MRPSPVLRVATVLFASVLAATPNAGRAQLELVDGRLRATVQGVCLELESVRLADDTRIVECP